MINYKKIYDISMKIFPEMPVYKGKESKRPVYMNDSNFQSGTAYESSLHMNLHTGTHIDSPLHMIEDGKTIDFLKLDDMITPCKVLDLTHVKSHITADDLKSKKIVSGDFLLFKTKNSYEPLLENDFIYLEKSGASFLADIGINGVGIDALGIERDQPNHETHLSLMNAGIHIIEGLVLKDVPEDTYTLIALPLKVTGVEAAPLRAILMK